MSRSLMPTVRNPVLSLPGIKKLQALPETTREPLRQILLEISYDARARAEAAWKKHKAPMACYWKFVGVIFGHIARALR